MRVTSATKWIQNFPGFSKTNKKSNQSLIVYRMKRRKEIVYQRNFPLQPGVFEIRSCKIDNAVIKVKACILKG